MKHKGKGFSSLPLCFFGHGSSIDSTSKKMKVFQRLSKRCEIEEKLCKSGHFLAVEWGSNGLKNSIFVYKPSYCNNG